MFKKNDIELWLKKHNIKIYSIIEEEKLLVDVFQDVDLSHLNLTDIPVQFRNIDGIFKCNNNYLSNLNFAPIKVNDTFNCSSNLLKNLKNCPQYVGVNFYASCNKLKNLSYFPEFVAGYVSLHYNPALGELEHIEDFNILQLEHLKYKSKKIAHKLEKALILTKTKAKIKI